jgi:NAD(P)-dependent dehydrogenase (short-subunit alcohol dehydrogenase family)
LGSNKQKANSKKKTANTATYFLVEFVELDVASQESIKKAAVEISSRVDHLDVLVNDAAIYSDEGISALKVDPASVIHAKTPQVFQFAA